MTFPRSCLFVLVAFLAITWRADGATYFMQLNRDGTFTSPSTGTSALEILEGDTVVFIGLERTDGIVQTENPTAGTIDPCTELAKPYDAPGGVPDNNEFTGPMRTGVSGIMSLGPLAKPCLSTSFSEHDRGAVMPVASACGGQQAAADWLKGVVYDPADGHYYELCRDNAVSNETMRLTFENPDVDGVIVRINWNAIETAPGGFDWTTLDSQMDQAVYNGKVFTLDFRAGIWGVPQHHYIPFGGLVEPFEFWTTFDQNPRDQGNSNDPAIPPSSASCGGRHLLPSPGDVNFRNAYIAFLTEVIRHVRDNTAWWQGLAYFKLSGVNFNTSEGKTAKLCNQACRAVDTKFCASQKWVDIEGAYPGLGWTPERLYAYYREVGSAIYAETMGQKSIGFQLIQNGYPIADSVNGNYEVYNPQEYIMAGVAGDDGNPADDGQLPAFDEQTRSVLNLGQQGRLFNLAGDADPVAGRAFVPQHSGLQTNPEDTYFNRPGTYVCAYNQRIISEAASPLWGMAIFPLTEGWVWADLDDAGSGCPNKWNRQEGYEGQLTGWQTVNGIFETGEVSSALFNATTNSNGIFVELYEESLWKIMRSKGTGPAAAPLSDDPANEDFAYNKNLHQWSDELHVRRKLLDIDTDPFPASWTHTFGKDLVPGQAAIYRFISPYKCKNGGWDGQPTPQLKRVGLIRVTGI